MFLSLEYVEKNKTILFIRFSKRFVNIFTTLLAFTVPNVLGFDNIIILITSIYCQISSKTILDSRKYMNLSKHVPSNNDIF